MNDDIIEEMEHSLAVSDDVLTDMEEMEPVSFEGKVALAKIGYLKVIAYSLYERTKTGE